MISALISIRSSLMVIFRLANFQRGSDFDYPKWCREIAASLNDFINRWCKWENVEPAALKEWKINIFKIIDARISFYVL